MMLQAVAEMKLLFHGLLHCLVFLNKTLQSRSAFHYPRVANYWSNLTEC